MHIIRIHHDSVWTDFPVEKRKQAETFLRDEQEKYDRTDLQVDPRPYSERIEVKCPECDHAGSFDDNCVRHRADGALNPDLTLLCPECGEQFDPYLISSF